MYTHDYSDELHVKRSDKQIPIGIAIVLFLVAVAGLWYSYQLVKAHEVAQEQAMLQTK